MELVYRFRFAPPGASLGVRIDAGEAPLFEARLAMRRRPISTAQLARMLVRHPLPTARVVANIYWPALRLHRKGAGFHPHPGGAPVRAAARPHAP
jgi:hypothetical protein